MTIGLLSLCPCITSLKFLSCSPCTVPPFELYSGGVVVPIIASAIFEHICLSSPLLWRIPGPWLIQPRGIEVSFLYRNAGWALQAGICREALAFNHYTRKWGFGIKAIFIVWPSTSTDHNRGFGPGVGSFEVRIADFESCPQLPFRQKASRCLGPKPQQNLVCHPWGFSVDAGACFWTRGCEDNLVHLCIRGGFLGRKICLLLQLCAAFNLWKTAIWIKCCCFLVEGSIFVLKEFHICLVCSWYLRDGLFESLRGKGVAHQLCHTEKWDWCPSDDLQSIWLWFGFLGRKIFTGPRCLWGPVYGSRCLYLRPGAFWNFPDVTLMMIPTQYDWWCQFKAIPCNS